MIIAIDGPAASGKGTLGRRLAAHYGLTYLDTGALYRAVARRLLDTQTALTDVRAAVAAANALTPQMLSDPRLRETGVGDAASRVAGIPEVRAALLAFQRKVAHTPPGAVLDGRDIGTVVCPEADVKLFVTATAEARAQRRARELTERGETVSEAHVLAEIKARDERDQKRAVAPMTKSPDALLLDTTHMDIEAAFQAALALVEQTLASKPQSG